MPFWWVPCGTLYARSGLHGFPWIIHAFPCGSIWVPAGIYGFPRGNLCVPLRERLSSKQGSMDSLMGSLRETMSSLRESMGSPGVIHGFPFGNL